MKFNITGGKSLSGKITISGNKNSVFPCVAASLLTDEEVVLENISDLRDTQVLIQILKKLGVSVEKSGTTLTIKASSIKQHTLPENLLTKLRGSVVLAGSLLARINKVKFSHPGGDIIGRRSIDTHLEGFKALGAKVKKSNLNYLVTMENQPKKNIEIFFKEASVTATENLILASTLRPGIVILKNCAKEPHVIDLCKMISQMGGQIVGIGSDTVTITGVDKLYGTKFRIGMDCIEAGTYMIAAAITGGKVEIKGVDATDISPIQSSLMEFGIKIENQEGSLIAWADKLKSPTKITTNIWPGFPTDLMSAVMVLATQSKGAILCHDWMYESRMFFVDKLISMGANITLADPHRVIILGPTKLKGRRLETPDIRAGMALVLASLVAKGKSIINQAELIERGYEDVLGKLKSLGAEIQKEED